MSVDDWARWAKHRADTDGQSGEPKSTVRSVPYKVGRVDGAIDTLGALLSDEAVEAAEDEQYRHGRDLVFGGGCACGEPFPLTRQGIRAHDLHVARAAIQAAIDAVTKEARND